MKIVKPEKFTARFHMEIAAYIGKIGNRVCLLHDEVVVVRGDEQDFGKEVGIIHFGNDGFYLVLGMAFDVFGGF